jgi:cellulose synthase/poly-beta-1,6-N-acetylglucosamine synthase-like glycosyltransferase
MAYNALCGRVLEFSMLLAAYTWIAYPLLLAALRWLGSHVSPIPFASTQQGPALPSVSVIIPAHNEEQRIAGKLRNCLELEYPRDQVEFIVCSDGSTDATEEIVRDFMTRDARIRWLQSQHRAGKSGVQNIAAAAARGDILFFTDANASMGADVLRILIDDLADPAVGLVTGTVHLGEPKLAEPELAEPKLGESKIAEPKIAEPKLAEPKLAEPGLGHAKDAVARSQGFYWRYELFLRVAESDLGILATASGQAMAVRRELYRPLPTCYGDDCILPLEVRLQGRRVVQERSALVFDTMPHSIRGELRARIRMTARNWAGTLARPGLLNPLRFPLTSWALFSHKLLRWLTPFFLGLAFLSNTGLVLTGRGTFFWWMQAGFYLSALVGWQLTRKQRSAGPFGYSFSFCLANVGFFLGMLKAFRNQKIVAY